MSQLSWPGLTYQAWERQLVIDFGALEGTCGVEEVALSSLRHLDKKKENLSLDHPILDCMHHLVMNAQPERSGHQARIYEPTFISSGGTRIFCMKLSAHSIGANSRMALHTQEAPDRHEQEYSEADQHIISKHLHKLWTLQCATNAQLSSNAARWTLFNSAESIKQIIVNAKAMASDMDTSKPNPAKRKKHISTAHSMLEHSSCTS
ncbi:hypothetical protein Pelo_16861 [Pelomyxa schiedti]|nr:hypothetical protein Pelo_16861 [Pelomyxa schiedti]